MENKTGKYFKYAIGEIMLVIIGILIALQINTWNTNQQNKEKLKALILDHKSELQINIEDFDFQYKRTKNYLERNRKFLKIKNLDSLPLDTLEVWIETFYINFGMNTNVNERFKSTQITEFAEYDTILRRMQDYYTVNYATILRNLKSHNKAVDKADEFWRNEQNVFEFKYSEGNNSFIQPKAFRKEKLIQLIKTPKVRNILKIDNRRKTEMLLSLEWWKKQAQHNINQINKKLNIHD